MHTPRVGSQNGLPPEEHSPSWVQPSSHSKTTGSQVFPDSLQCPGIRHFTHLPDESSQNARSPMHCALEPQVVAPAAPKAPVPPTPALPVAPPEAAEPRSMCPSEPHAPTIRQTPNAAILARDMGYEHSARRHVEPPIFPENVCCPALPDRPGCGYYPLEPKENSMSPLRRLLIPFMFVAVTGGLSVAACGGSDEAGLTNPNNPFGNDSCTSNAGCTGGDPYCIGGRCVQCASNADCTDANQICDTTSGDCKLTCSDNSACAQGGDPLCNTTRGVCVRCIADTDCPGGGERFCNAQVDRCVECRSNADCTGGQRICQAGRGKCIECVANSDCGGGEPLCNVSDNECVECLTNADCGSGGTCNGDNKCVAPCTSNAQCGGDTPACNVASGRCVECMESADCTSGGSPHCNPASNQCVECLTKDHCDPGKDCRQNEFKCD